MPAAGRISDILARYRKRQAEARKEHEASLSEDAKALNRFLDIRDHIIAPALEAIKGEILESGYAAEVGASNFGRPAVPGIALRIHLRQPAGARIVGIPQETPHIIYYFDARAVRSYESTMMGGGSAGPAKTYSLDQLTTESVRAQVTDWLEKVVGRGR